MQRTTMMGAAIAVALATLAWPHAANAAGKCWPDYPAQGDYACNNDGKCATWTIPNSCVIHFETASTCGDCVGCTHAVCDQGAPYTTGCYYNNPTVYGVCNMDWYCCSVMWDYMCTIEATQYFGAGCY